MRDLREQVSSKNVFLIRKWKQVFSAFILLEHKTEIWNYKLSVFRGRMMN